ncbi:MAG: OmpA family protein [Spirochaetia bacterium]|nr:OmpA family protein [Spirochaetia bacterium]
MGLNFILLFTMALISAAGNQTASQDVPPVAGIIRIEYAGVYYDKNDSKLDDESKVALRLLTRKLKSEDKKQIIIRSLADSKINKELAKKRAQIVGKYIAETGILAKDIEIQIESTDTNISMPIEIYLK